MGSAAVVVTHPQLEALLALLKRVELGAHEELLPQARPEPLHLAQRHRVLRTRHQVRDAVLLQLTVKTALAAPVRILPAAIGKHLLGRLILGDCAPVGLDHRLRGRAAIQTQSGEVARVVVHERRDVGVAASQPEGEDVALPHLVRRGPLEEARPRHVARSARAGLLQPRLVQASTHRLRAHPDKKPAPQRLGNALHPEVRVGPLHLQDLLAHRRREASPRTGRRLPTQPLLPLGTIVPHPHPQ